MFSLQHKDEFEKVLADYQMSDDAKRLLTEHPVVILTAITAAGRNTMIRELVKTGRYRYIVSDTTRPPRENDGVLEQNGVEYWFRSEDQVLADLKEGKFVEAAIIHAQQVSGISVRELKEAQSSGQIPINEIEVQGVDTVLRTVPGSLVPIFVLPPSYDEWIRRWTSRGQITEQEKLNRMDSARMEIQAALDKDYYHFLINDDLDKAIKGVDKIAHGQIDPKHEIAGRQKAQEILDRLNQA